MKKINNDNLKKCLKEKNDNYKRIGRINEETQSKNFYREWNNCAMKRNSIYSQCFLQFCPSVHYLRSRLSNAANYVAYNTKFMNFEENSNLE